MSFGRSANDFLIKEFKISIGTFTNPNTIGVDTTLPDAKFILSGDLGFIEQGSVEFAIAREFAEFISGTPGVKAAKDLTLKAPSITANLAQFNIDVIELAMGLRTQKNYEITTPVARTIQLAHLGSDQPVQPLNGYLLDGQLKDSRRFSIGIYQGQINTEDVTIALDGSSHATLPIEIEAFPDPSFGTDCVSSQKHYGYLTISNEFVCV